jgi:hypothetical protein
VGEEAPGEVFIDQPGLLPGANVLRGVAHGHRLSENAEGGTGIE